mmetsp:Transcript_8334/g.18937  ORF Transcript_8334/g.18937 Transcript_8334/m.18937 type:complete len:187 (-) Transcript_8334:100-660(-)|eukprot:748743-Hanusia_phi.AAC.8
MNNNARTGQCTPHSPSQTPSNQGGHAKELFTHAASSVTRLYRSPDRSHFALAANAVTALYREGEVEMNRSYNRGARDSLRECLEWVMRQGPYIDSSQMTHLLKQQIALYSSKVFDAEQVNNSLLSDHGPDFDEANEGPRETTILRRTVDDLPSDFQRKRRMDDDLEFDETLSQQLPQLWPRKLARR